MPAKFPADRNRRPFRHLSPAPTAASSTSISHLLAAEMVVDRVLQDPLEQHRQLGRRLFRIFLGELQHRVLDDVERRVLVADGEHRLLEGATLDLRQKCRNFGGGGQDASRWSFGGDYRASRKSNPVVRCSGVDRRRGATVRLRGRFCGSDAVLQKRFAFPSRRHKRDEASLGTHAGLPFRIAAKPDRSPRRARHPHARRAVLQSPRCVDRRREGGRARARGNVNATAPTRRHHDKG